MKILSIAVFIAWASTGAWTMQLSVHCDKLRDTLSAVSNSFGNSFQGIAQNVLSSGSNLLTLALTDPAQILGINETQLVLSLLHPPTAAKTKREMSGIVEQKEKDVLNSFATDLKDKLNREFAVAISDLQTLALKPLLLSHEQLTQKVQQIVSSHSHQMTALLESVPADLVKFVEKVLTSQNGHLSGILESLVQSASQLTQQFKPHVQSIQQYLCHSVRLHRGSLISLSNKENSYGGDITESQESLLSRFHSNTVIVSESD